MTVAATRIRRSMLLTSCLASALLIPSMAQAQLVRDSDLVPGSDRDSAGNPGQLTVTNTSANSTTITMNAPTVVSRWLRFNVPEDDSLLIDRNGFNNASLLARVVLGGGASDISGTISAPGVNFWLINQNGIMFGNKAAISANSFTASTLNVSEADFFDFYEGTDLFGNGTNTVRFNGSANALTATSNAFSAPTFVTDGSLMFVSQQLDLAASFSAGGRLAFVTATNVDVSFTPGSPLSYTVNAGTTVAGPQRVVARRQAGPNTATSGTLTGDSVEFALFTSAAAVDSILTVNGNVSATGAIPSRTGISLVAAGAGSPAARFDGNLRTAGSGVDLSAPARLTVNGNITGSNVGLDTNGALLVGAINASRALDIGGSLTPSSVRINGNARASRIDIVTTGALTAQALTATTGAIDVDATSVSAGNLRAATAVDVDASGNVALASVVANGGAVRVGAATLPASLTITGNARGTLVNMQANGAVRLGNVTSTAGRIDLASNSGLISAGAVSATGGNAVIAAAGRVTTSSIGSSGAVDVSSTGGGTLDLGALNAGSAIALDTSGNVLADSVTAGGAFTVGAAGQVNSVTLAGRATARSIAIDAANALNAQGLTATDGAIDIDAGRVTAGALGATGAIFIDAAGSVALGSARANTDGIGSGVLAIGAGIVPSVLAITGPSSGTTIDIQANGNVALGNVTSTNGAIELDSVTGSLAVGAVNATGGAANLTAQLGITTTSIVSTGSIDAESLGGGDLSLGNLTAGNAIAIDTSGSIAIGSAAAANGLQIGSAVAPDAVSLTGNAVADFIVIDSTGGIDAQNLRATAGRVDLNAASDASGTISAGSVRATDNIAIDGGGVITLGAAIADSDGSGTGAVSIGAATASTSLAVNGLVSGTSVTIDTIGDLGLANVTSTIGEVSLDAGGALSAGRITAATTLGIGDATQPTSVTLTGAALADSISLSSQGLIETTDLTAVAGGILLDAGIVALGAITAEDVRATGEITVRSNGDATFASLNADSDVDGAGNLSIGLGRTPASLTVDGTTSAAAITIDTVGDVSLGNVNSRTGSASVTSADGALTAGIVRGAGLIRLEAQNAIGTSSIRSTGGAVEIESTAGGAVDLGDVSAATSVTFDTTGAAQAGNVNAGGQFVVGNLRDPASVVLGNVRASSIDIDSTGALVAGTIQATAGGIDIDTLSLTTGSVRATGAVDLFASGGNAVVGGNLAGSTVDILATGDFVAANVTASAGAIDIDAATVSAGRLAATSGIAVDAAGTVSLTSAAAGSGNLEIGLAAVPSRLTITGASSGTAVELVAIGDISLGAVNSSAGAVEIDSTTGGIAASVVSATGGNAELTAQGDVRTASITTTAAIDVDSLGGGNLSLGDLDAGGTISLDTAGSIRAGAVTASGALSVGAAATPGAVTFTDNASASSIAIVSTGSVATANLASSGDVTVDAGNISVGAVSAQDLSLVSEGALTTGGVVVASGIGVFQANNVDIQDSVTVNGSSFTIRANAGRGIGLGSVGGGLSLSDAELDLITTANLVIDAGDQSVTIDSVSFASGSGSNSVVVATTGEIAILGDVSGTGAARTFRFGGDAAGATGSLASRISANIVLATIDFGDAALDLRGNDIVFGQQRLISALAGRPASEVAALFVGNAGSALYNPLIFGSLGPVREADPVYLRAGSMVVTYGENAVFQNTSLAQQNSTDYTGISLGSAGNSGVLTLSPIDTTNAFAFFGDINGLEGVDASLAGPAVIVINGNTDPGGSRVNGCIIGSAAGCLTTIIGTTALEVPRENLSVLTGDDGLLVPFDPLVGTNNEGLFSDAAANPQPSCEPDETGQCPDEEGEQ